MGALELRLLGPVEVRAAGRTVYVGPPRQRCVLAALAVDAGRPVQTDTVIERVWGQAPPDGVQHAIYVYVSRIRGLLRAAAGETAAASLARRTRGYVLDLPSDRIDAHKFRSLVADAATGPDGWRVRNLRLALDLWRGTPLADVPGDWAARTREAWRQQHVEAVAAWAQAELRLANPTAVIAPLTDLVAEQPFAEKLVAILMRALFLTGHRAEALDQYTATRHRLIEQLGVDPGPDLRAAHEAILRGDVSPPAGPPARASEPPSAPVAPAQLPLDVVGFCGRAPEIEALDAMMPAPGTPPLPAVAVLSGMAGVGKTGLAVHWAHRVRHRFPDGQLHVDLRGYAQASPVEPIEALSRLLHGLGVAPATVPLDVVDAAAVYRTLLADRRVLVVLDNAGTAEQVRPLLPGGGACMVVITSRNRLDGLVALDGARQLTLDALAPDESLALLAHVLGEQRVAAERDRAEELAGLCAHLPLALRIAAANMAADAAAIGRIVDALRSDDRLAALEIPGDPQAAVRVTFDLSYRVLPPAAQRLFRLVSLMPGQDFTVSGAASLIGDDSAAVPSTMALLVGAHLLGQPRPYRYTMHDLVRRYGQHRAEQEDSDADRAAALTGLHEHYLRTIDAAARLLYPQTVRLEPVSSGVRETFADRSAALAWLDDERANLVSAVRRAEALGLAPMAWLLADALRGYFWIRRPMADWLDVAECGRSAAVAAGDLSGQAACHTSLGVARRCTGEYQAATGHLTTALALSRQTGWSAAESSILGSLAIGYAEIGDVRRAVQHFSEALELNRRLGRTAGEAVSVGNLGNLRSALGQLHEAVADLTEALELYRKTGNVGGEALMLTNLGGVLRILGPLDAARRRCEQGLALHREIGDRYGEAIALSLLGEIRARAGNPEHGVGLATAAVKLARQIGDSRVQASALTLLGAVELLAGDPAAAITHYEQAAALARSTGNRIPLAEALTGVGASHHAAGRHGSALPSLTEALAIARNDGYLVIESTVLTVLAEIHLARDEIPLAVQHARAAADINRQTGQTIGSDRTDRALADAVRRDRSS
jgi:DNA-binding SARP family transcriptional activator/tetratricopeptide (TPR) repeat protein